ncbi:MAG TPA: hypothetical protein VFA57_16000 [Pseudolabrys sp.]|nr:hypothetical protein [Pseudolabrys sp.]
MWDDRFLFVVAALTAMGLWIAFDHRARAKRDDPLAFLSRLTAHSVIIVACFVVGVRLWYYRDDLGLPEAGSIITILIAAVFGSFTAKFIRSLFGADFGRRDPIMGACVLVLLSVAYSLPLYSQAISGFLSGIGLSSVKTPFIEFTLRDSQSGRAQITSVSGGAGSAQFTAQAVPRATDPAPGLGWLKVDAQVKCDAEPKCSATVEADQQYINFLEPPADIKPSSYYDEVQHSAETFLGSIRPLSDCLNEYVKVVPDSQLLLVDVKGVIDVLFTLHAAAKRAVEDFANNKPTSDELSDASQSSAIDRAVAGVRKDIGDKFHIISQSCEPKPQTAAPQKIFYLQPYSSLVLADLLLAHGAPDEAIRVLAEWLNMWNAWNDKENSKSNKLPEWYKLRVASRLALFMKNLAGQTNIAYREFFSYYKAAYEDYVGRASIRLDQYPDKCKRWKITSASDSKVRAEKKAFYLLLANEDEELRTEISFLAEQSNFEALDKLFRRAVFMASIGPECLPEGLSDERFYNNAIVADHQVTAGLLGLTVADRMASLARSSGDRERAREVHRVAEDHLRQGWGSLRNFVLDGREKNRKKPWSDRIFAEASWENSASLATRFLSQLRSGN